jgi:hypothetical protein
MADFDEQFSVKLPEALRQQFAEVERRLWRAETTIAVGVGAGGLMASFLALFFLDRFGETPVWGRWALFLAGLACAAAAALVWARRWVWSRRDIKALANLVQKKHRRLGDRLLGIVELANEERHFANFSPALYHAAIHQVAEESKEYDFPQSVSLAGAKKIALGAVLAAACVLMVFAALPGAAGNALARWGLPGTSVPRYALVTLAGLPKDLIVAHDEPFVINASVHYRSFWKPRRAFGLWPRQTPIESAVEGERIRLSIPGQVESGVLQVRVGDARGEVTVLPTYRPSLQELTAVLQLPDYLKYPLQEQTVPSGTLPAVEGSRISFRGKVNRPLSAAHMQNGGGEPIPLKIEGENFLTGSTQPDGAAEFTFDWTDNLGLTNSVPLRLAVQMQPDAPPVPEILDFPHEAAVLNSDVLHIRLQASDDFGVRDFGLTWDLTEDSPQLAVATTELKTLAPTPRSRTIEKTFLWSPSLLRIPPGSTVDLQGYARDYYPDRERARTGAYRIHVLSPEQHAEMVRQKLEETMAQVEEVTRLQEKVVAGLAEVKDADKMPAAQQSSRLGQSKDEQMENATHLDQLSKQGEQTLREAMKNPLLNEETIRQWSQSMMQWQQLSHDKMPAAAQSMQQARQSPAASKDQVADALEKAEAVLEALEKMESKANEHMDDLQALTLAQRLRKVGGEEKEIAGSLLASAPETVGLLAPDLPEKLKLLEQGLTRDQGGAQKETVTLQGEISRFFERTQKQGYGQVNQEMKDTQAADELDRLGGLIQNNIGLQASDHLGQWSDRFQKWSDKLEPPSSDENGGAKTSSSGKSQNDLTKQLIALLRLRESEVNLRDQTTVLDQNKGEPASYKERAASLSASQDKLADDLDHIHQKAPLEELSAAFNDAAGAMKVVAGTLRQPQTGQPADVAEVKTVDTLSDLINLINEQAQRPNSKPSSAPADSASDEEMQFLLQMMRQSGQGQGASAQPATGLNRAGGKTDRVGAASRGDTTGTAAGSRDVHKTAGVIEDAPVEFREALENYFHGIEQSGQ